MVLLALFRLVEPAHEQLRRSGGIFMLSRHDSCGISIFRPGSAISRFRRLPFLSSVFGLVVPASTGFSRNSK
jgi:hypothetical protein